MLRKMSTHLLEMQYKAQWPAQALCAGLNWGLGMRAQTAGLGEAIIPCYALAAELRTGLERC